MERKNIIKNYYSYDIFQLTILSEIAKIISIAYSNENKDLIPQFIAIMLLTFIFAMLYINRYNPQIQAFQIFRLNTQTEIKISGKINGFGPKNCKKNILIIQFAGQLLTILNLAFCIYFYLKY